jgi:hypothetical protein
MGGNSWSKWTICYAPNFKLNPLVAVAGILDTQKLYIRYDSNLSSPPNESKGTNRGPFAEEKVSCFIVPEEPVAANQG